MALSYYGPGADSGRRDHPVLAAFRRVDLALLGLTAALLAAGLLALYGTTGPRRENLGLEPLYWVERQAIAISVGLVGMVVAMAVDYRALRRWAPVFYVGCLGLLAGLFVAGTNVNGARAWFDFGGFQLQPSELTKASLILMIAAYAATERGEPLPYHRFVKSLLLLGAPLVLVVAQPDFGTASAMVASVMGLLLVARARLLHIVLITLLAVASAGVIWYTDTLAKYQQDRLVYFINQEETKANADLIRQVKFSKQAITIGRVTGAGLGEGVLTNRGDVPEQRTDFIFSAIGEQFGLVGATLVLALFLLLVLRLIRIAQLASDPMGSLIAAGAASLVCWHVFQNVAMNMGIMPVTGIPLPMVSYGGSSVVTVLVLLGLAQSVHMHRDG
jgi:rod shape determining protein RodA